MGKKKGISVKVRMLMLSVLPALVIGIVLSVVGIFYMTTGMETEISDGLMNSARLYHDLRLDEEIVEGDHSLEESLKAKTGYDFTYFKGDSRLLTSLDKSVVGTPAADAVIAQCLKGGQEFQSDNTQVAGKPYFVAYVPVKDDNGDVIGMCFAGKSRESIESIIAKSRNVMIIIAVCFLIAIVIISVRSASTFSAAISAIRDAVESLANGELKKTEKYTNRSDEIGDALRATNSAIDKLGSVVGSVRNASEMVTNQAGELSGSSQRVSETSDGVSEAVEEMAKGATEQANVVQKVTENISLLSDAIQTVSDNAESLAGTAATMNDASQKSASALQDLSSNMNVMDSAVVSIANTMRDTNDAVEKVNDKVDGITSIASQTNLLALNASIEAARAGEAGRGFAVVAEEIGKLATESAETASQIRDEMLNLLKHAQDALKKTDEVSAISTKVNSVLDDTVGTINGLIDGVGSTVDGVNTISGLTEECNASKDEIVDAMSSLSAISEENAASTEETSASMHELNTTVGSLSEVASRLNDVSSSLNTELAFFKVDDDSSDS